MSLYDELNELTLHCDLEGFGQRLAYFAEEALAGDDRKRMVSLLYERVCQYAALGMSEDVFSREKFSVYSDRAAFGMYLASALPPRTSPVKTLKALLDCSKELDGRFRPSSGTRISKEQVRSILQYVDERFGLISKALAA